MADPKLTKQQKDDLKEFNELLKQQPKLFRSILGISETIKKSVTDTSDASEKIVKSNKAYLDIAKQVLSNTKNIHKETFDVADLSDQILKAQKSGDKVLVNQLKQLNKLQQGQKRYNNVVNAGANSIEKMMSGIESTFRQIPFIGDFLADAINFGDMSKNMQGSFREGAKASGGFLKEGLYQGTVEGTTSGMVESANLGKSLGKKMSKWFRAPVGEGVSKTGKELVVVDKNAKGVAGKFNVMKLGAIGLAAAVSTMAAKMAKFAFETGLSLERSIKLGPSLFINSGYVKSMAEEFGTINDVNTKIAWQLKKQSFFYGIEAEQAVKILRIQSALSDSSHEQLINVQNTVAEFARSKGVLPSKVFDDIANSTELMAKYADSTAEGFMKAAVHIRTMGIGLEVADQIASHLLDIEGSIGAQFMANSVLQKNMNLDRARQLVLNNDLVGMMEEVKKQLGGELEFQRLNLVERDLLSKAIGTDISNVAKMISAQEASNEVTKQAQGNYKLLGAIIGGVVGLLVAAVPAIRTAMSGGLSFAVDAMSVAKGLTVVGIGAAGGAAVGSTFAKQQDFVSRPGMNPIPFSTDDTIIGTKNPAGLGGGGNSQIAMAITNQTRAMNKLEQTISKGQAQSTRQRQSMIDATTKGQNKLYRGFIEG